MKSRSHDGLTAKGLLTLYENRVSLIFDSEKFLGQSQSWLRTMQTDLWKLFVNSRIFEFLTACSKNQTLAHVQKCDCVPLINKFSNYS